MSTSPDCSAVKRCCAVSGTYFTFSGSPANSAAEMARQKSISKPLYLPWLSGMAKPGTPVGTPQVMLPACFALSKVGPAWAGTAIPKPIAIASATIARSPVLLILAPYSAAPAMCCRARALARRLGATLTQAHGAQQRERGGAGPRRWLPERIDVALGLRRLGWALPAQPGDRREDCDGGGQGQKDP